MRSRYSSRRQMVCALMAYAIALQALLTAWAGALQPANAGFDPLSVICRTITTEDGQQAPAGKLDHGLACHCTAACHAGHCCAGPVGAATIIPVPRLAEVILPHRERAAAGASWLVSDHSARGPPVSG